MDAVGWQVEPHAVKAGSGSGPGFPRAWPMKKRFFADEYEGAEIPFRREVSKAHVVGAHGLLQLVGDAGSVLTGDAAHKAQWHASLHSDRKELTKQLQQHLSPPFARSLTDGAPPALQNEPHGPHEIVGGDALQTLETSLRHANTVEVTLRQDIDSYQEEVVRIGKEACAVERVARDAVRNIEENRKDHFSRSRRDVVQAEMQFCAERDEANAQLTELYQKLQDSQDACEERVLKIYEKWVRGEAASERYIRDLEQNMKDATKERSQMVEQKMADCEQENVSLQKAGAECVKNFRLRKEEALADILQKEVTTRAADLDAANKAASTGQELRAKPEANQKQMDLVIEDYMTDADKKIAELESAAAEKVAAAKAHARAADAEAARLRKETDDAWASLRAAHFELRRLNMHDFSHRINSGEFDEPQ